MPKKAAKKPNKQTAKRPVGRPRKKKAAVRPKRPAGRPPVEVNEKVVEGLAAVGCSAEEIASYVGCNRSVIFDRFSDCLKKGHFQQKVSLRRKQYELAMAGDKTMLVWLGKQYLDQCEPMRVGTLDDTTPRVAGKTAAEFEGETVKLLLARIEKRRGEGVNGEP